MKIIQITPGAGGNFYCENCLRDNALVLELRRLGHETLMVPLYLPLATDGPDATGGAPLFFGGIGVYLAERSVLFRKAPRWFQRLLDSPRLLKWAAKRVEMTKARDLGEPTLSMLRGEDGQQVGELERLIAWLSEAGRPDVLCLSNALLAGMARRMKQELGVPILCALQDEDMFVDALPEPYASRAWDLLRDRAADIDAFLPVSHYYGDVMQKRLGLGPERVHVVPIGIDLQGYAPADTEPERPTIGYLAQLRHANGLDLLVEAFLAIHAGGRVPGVRLRISGANTPGNQPYVDAIADRLAEAGTADDVEFLPMLDRTDKQAFLRSLSVLSVPAREGVAFGTFIIEAAASGVPVVEPRLGAFAELVEATGSGVLVEPEDTEALAVAIEGLLRGPDEARTLGRRGRQAAIEYFSIERMARDVAEVFTAVAAA
jgi:glycosyltransferase involved in cell wall biosynthesis